ncbi:unnamed protein product [Sphagnum troendelagicum]
MGQTTIDLLPNIEPKNLSQTVFLGQGSYGSVVGAEWLGQKVALKTFQGIDTRSFLLEANILAGLFHPHIVQIFGVCTGGRQASIVMERMHGDLGKVIDSLNRGMSTSRHRGEQIFQLRVALDIMLQIAEAMQYLHRKKITHRDLKSRNMLINPAQIPELAKAGYMDVKVADFGVSKIVNDCEGSSQTFSMPPFSIAPEDVDTEIETDDRAHDISTLLNRLHDLQLQRLMQELD